MNFIIYIAAIIPSIIAYSIQGNWSLVSVVGYSLNNQSVIMNIDDYIYKKNLILQKITLFGCKQILLQAQISQNSFFINFDSYYAQPIDNLTCNIQNSLTQTYRKLKSVFFFDIVGQNLHFNDPFGKQLLVFERIIPKIKGGIVGIWSMNQLGQAKTSYLVQISPKQITLCQGNLIYNYTLIPNQNIITLTQNSSNCSSKTLSNIFSTAKYYRFYKGILNIYDAKVKLISQLQYSNAYNPQNPIFNVKKTNQVNNNQKNRPEIKNVPSQPISTSNFVGRWRIQALFNIPFPASPYSILFENSNLTLNGGCKNYTYNYTLNSTIQIITIGNSSSSSKNCSQSDDTLFNSGISKMYKYLLTNANGVYILKFYDQSGNPGYSLQLNTPPKPLINSINPVENIKTTAPIKSVVTPPPVQIPLTPGKYLMLLLLRRDLPRVIANIAGNQISYKSCNSIKHTYLPAQLKGSNSSISFTSVLLTNSTCKINNDEIYYKALNSAVSYSYDANLGTVILSNSAGVEVVTLTSAI